MKIMSFILLATIKIQNCNQILSYFSVLIIEDVMCDRLYTGQVYTNNFSLQSLKNKALINAHQFLL